MLYLSATLTHSLITAKFSRNLSIDFKSNDKLFGKYIQKMFLSQVQFMHVSVMPFN